MSDFDEIKKPSHEGKVDCEVTRMRQKVLLERQFDFNIERKR